MTQLPFPHHHEQTFLCNDPFQALLRYKTHYLFLFLPPLPVNSVYSCQMLIAPAETTVTFDLMKRV